MNNINNLPVFSYWQHHNSNVYQVILITNTESNRDKYPVTICYRNMCNNTIWSRQYTDWHRSMTRITASTMLYLKYERSLIDNVRYTCK